MHFNDIREAQQNQQVNIDPSSHEWEQEHMPTLHSGFTSGTSKDPKWNVLFMSMWYKEGMYMVRLQDRETGQRAFIEIESLDNIWRELEIKLVSGRMAWRDDRSESKNSYT